MGDFKHKAFLEEFAGGPYHIPSFFLLPDNTTERSNYKTEFIDLISVLFGMPCPLFIKYV